MLAMPERPDVLVRQAPPVPHGRRTSSLQRRRSMRSSSNGAACGCVRWCVTTCVSRCGAGAAPSSSTTSSSTPRTGRRRAAIAWTTLLRARAIENQALLRRRESRGRRRQRASRMPATAWCSISPGSRCSSSTTTPQVITVPLDLRGLRAWRDKFPAHLDADAFTLEYMKKPTLVNHPPDVSPPPGNLPVIAPIYQSVKYEFETVDDTLRMLRGETPGYFYMRASNPTTRQLELTLAAAAGPRRLPGHRLGRQRHRADAASALTKQGDHILCLRRNLRADAQHHPPAAGALRRRAHHAVDRGPGRHRKRAGHAPDAPGDLREPDQSRSPRWRTSSGWWSWRIGTARSRSSTTPSRVSTSTVNTRSICSCTASPSTPRARATSWAAR